MCLVGEWDRATDAHIMSGFCGNNTPMCARTTIPL